MGDMRLTADQYEKAYNANFCKAKYQECQKANTICEQRLKKKPESKCHHNRDCVKHEKNCETNRPSKSIQASARADSSFYWPKVDGVPTVYYEIEASAEELEDLILYAIDEYKWFTCIRFVEDPSAPNRIVFRRNGQWPGCWSHVGMQGGAQDLNLGTYCDYDSIVIHELGHALSRWHEHTRPDRDDSITIFIDNILFGARGNFDVQANTNTFNVPYDYYSIMHYEGWAFSKDGSSMTIATKDPDVQWDIGWSWELRLEDEELFNKMYCMVRKDGQSAKIAIQSLLKLRISMFNGM